MIPVVLLEGWLPISGMMKKLPIDRVLTLARRSPYDGSFVQLFRDDFYFFGSGS